MRMSFIRRASMAITLVLAATAPAVAAALRLNIELQSDCVSSDDIKDVLGDKIFPGLQTLTAPSPTTSFSSFGRDYENSETALQNAFQSFSISSGDDRRHLDDTNDNEDEDDGGLFDDLFLQGNTNVTTTAAPSSLRGGGGLSRPLSVPTLDCPVFSRCPCEKCPGHWCLVFCGYGGGQRRTLLSSSTSTEEGQPSVPFDHLESFYCDWLELMLLLDLDETCLSKASIIRCSLE